MNDFVPKDTCKNENYVKLATDITMNNAMITSLVKALQFVINHKSTFKKEFPCDNCYQAIENGKQFFLGAIQEADLHLKEKIITGVKN
jgi:hypothetical protein